MSEISFGKVEYDKHNLASQFVIYDGQIIGVLFMSYIGVLSPVKYMIQSGMPETAAKREGFNHVPSEDEGWVWCQWRGEDCMEQFEKIAPRVLQIKNSRETKDFLDRQNEES